MIMIQPSVLTPPPTILWDDLTCQPRYTEDSYSVTRTIDGLPYFLTLTDTAGQEEYRGLWAASNLNSDAFLLVYDITNDSSLETLDHFMEMIDVETETREEKNRRLLKQFYNDCPAHGMNRQPTIGRPAPVKIVAGNKCDLKEARVVSSRQGLEWARRRGCGFMETSAWEMVNIEETFALIIRRVVEARKLHREQQLSQFYALRQANSFTSSSRFFSPYRRAAQPVAHSQTAPLTSEERLDPTGRSISSGAHSQRLSLWSNVTRALTRRTKGPSKHLDSLQQRSNPWGAPSPPETLSTQSSKRPDQDINDSPYYANKEMRQQPHQDTFQSERFKGAERISLPWWKRLCDYR
ncbi:hypothetical protein FQN49_003893 [Arthroderma sp. PD_2]|nr:hypothetical protein FQN49_003893 [Arthroderma sp. PD_2]